MGVQGHWLVWLRAKISSSGCAENRLRLPATRRAPPRAAPPGFFGLPNRSDTAALSALTSGLFDAPFPERVGERVRVCWPTEPRRLLPDSDLLAVFAYA